MFTGIIREVGRLRERNEADGIVRFRIDAPRMAPSLQPGGSIAVDGVCLTVTERDDASFAADLIPETIARTRFRDIAPGEALNLELPLVMGQPLDGHIVQGHVDGVGEIAEVRSADGDWVVTVRTGPELAPFLAEKGSVAVNGVSLTVTTVTPDTFSVALIPTTLRETNLGALGAGAAVNVEVDVLARYIARREEMAKWPS